MFGLSDVLTVFAAELCEIREALISGHILRKFDCVGNSNFLGGGV